MRIETKSVARIPRILAHDKDITPKNWHREEGAETNTESMQVWSTHGQQATCSLHIYTYDQHKIRDLFKIAFFPNFLNSILWFLSMDFVCGHVASECGKAAHAWYLCAERIAGHFGIRESGHSNIRDM